MLSNIAKHNNQLIKIQLSQNQQLLNDIIKVKDRKRNYSYFEGGSKKGSIFEKPHFQHKFQLNMKERQLHSSRQPFTSQTCRNISITEGVRSQRAVPKKTNCASLYKNKYGGDRIKLFIGDTQINPEKTEKIIHSRKSNNWSMVSNKNPKIHHERVYEKPRRDSFTFDTEIVEEPGFMNLCFYKNTLQQMENIKTVRQFKRKSPQKQQKQRMNRNKVKYTKYKGILTDQNTEDCRPWSPQNQLGQTQFSNYKSLHLKLQI